MNSESQNSLASPNDSGLDEDTVATYLLEHPEFFINQEELLASLRIPHKSGGAISLLERQVSLLRRRNEESQEKIRHFIDNAKENDELFEKTRSVILDILASNSLPELSAFITGKLKENFSASCSTLFFATNKPDENSELSLLPLDQTRKVLGKLFQRKRAYCGKLDTDQTELFFPDTPAINSAAIVPIHFNDDKTGKEILPGIPLLVIASNKPQHFNSSLDTLFLDFIGEVLSAHIVKLV
jgi:uncharacterized protein YigA (DUF484 family)